MLFSAHENRKNLARVAQLTTMGGEVSDTFNENGRTIPLMIFSSLKNRKL